MTRPRDDHRTPPTGDRRNARGPGRSALRVIGAVCAAAGLVTLLLGMFPHLQLLSRAGALMAAVIPYGMVAWLLSAVLLGISGGRRSRLLVLAAVLALGVQVAWTQPYWPHAVDADADGAAVTVMTVNLRCDVAATEDLVAAIEREGPDVVVLVDVIPTVWRELGPSLVGMGTFHQTTRRSFQPEVWEVPGEPCFTGVAARGPIRLVAATDSGNPQHVLVVDLPASPVTLIAVDVENPVQGFSDWKADLTAVREAATMVEPDSPVLVVGDFNAVREHAPMGALRRAGLVDAAEQAGAGWVRTFPSDWTGVPPILAIDHVLLRGGLTAVSVETFSVEGSDHLGLVARILLRDRATRTAE